MKHGEYTLATQLGKRGFFGKVVLSVDANGGTGTIRVDFDPERAAEWQIGAHFGIDYILERIPQRKLFPKGATIHVESIQGHTVDTTNLVIAYAAANALLHALDLEASETKKPDFDKEHGLFVFP
jgi:hypothetical protein